jgi:hypothetical protein
MIKKLLLTILFTLTLSGGASAEKILLVCQIEGRSEKPYLVSLDLNNKVLDTAKGGLFKITSISNANVIAERKQNISEKSYFAKIVLDRQRGDMIFQNSVKDPNTSEWIIIENINFYCNRSPLF